MEFLKVILVIFLCIRCSESGTLIARPENQVQRSLYNEFWNKFNNLVSGTLHFVGSFLPLRGLATIAKDIGIPYADNLLHALTPSKQNWNFVSPDFSVARSSQRRSDNLDHLNKIEDKYVSMRDELSSAVGAAFGNEQCKKRLACLSGRHLSHVNGASSIALLVNSASSLLPDDFREPLSIVKDSILYSDNCDQYEC